MLGYQEKIIQHTRKQKIQIKETEQISEADMAGMFELSDWKLKTTIIICSGI